MRPDAMVSVGSPHSNVEEQVPRSCCVRNYSWRVDDRKLRSPQPNVTLLERPRSEDFRCGLQREHIGPRICLHSFAVGDIRLFPPLKGAVTDIL